MRLLTTALVLALLAATPALAPEKLRIATTGDYPPFNHVDDASEIAGFDVDMARALCAELGAECEIVLEEWERLIPELRAGSFDAIAASMSIAEERRQLRELHGPVTAAAWSASWPVMASVFDPADAAGKTIGAALATIASDWLVAEPGWHGDDRAVYRPARALRRPRRRPAGCDVRRRPRLIRLASGCGGRRLRVRRRGIPVWTKGSASRCATRTHPWCWSRLNGAHQAIWANGAYERINARYFPFSIY